MFESKYFMDLLAKSQYLLIVAALCVNPYQFVN